MISVKPRAGGLCKIGFHSWKLQVNILGEFPLYRYRCRRTACDIFSSPFYPNNVPPKGPFWRSPFSLSKPSLTDEARWEDS
jgi:hypothetical protein